MALTAGKAACTLPAVGPASEGVLGFPAGKGSARPGEVGCFPFGFAGYARGQEMRFSSH